jgi:hypothetical protein
LLIGYDETHFTSSLNYQTRNADSEMDLLARQRRQMADILRGLPPVAWARQGIHSERGLVTLEEMVRIEADHIPHHVRHIVDKRRALGLPVAN